MLMNIFRKMVLGLLATVLSFSLLTLAWVHVGNSTIRNKATVKGWFDKSGFYDKITDVLLEKVNNSAGNGQNQSTLPINDPQIQSVFKQAFSPELVKNSVNAILDGGYSWANGDSKDLNFSIDLTSAKQALGDGIATYVTNRFAALPVCIPQDLTTDLDYFNASCRPSFVTPAQAGATAREQLFNQDFLKNPVITADSISGTNNSGTLKQKLADNQQAQSLRTAYQKTNQLPIALAVLSLIVAAGIVFISTDRLKGLRRVGWITMISGVFLLAVYIVVGFVLSALTKKINSGSLSAKEAALLVDFAKATVDSSKKVFLLYAAGYGLGGLGLIVASMILINRQKAEHPEPKTILDEEESPIADSELDPEKKTDKPVHKNSSEKK